MQFATLALFASSAVAATSYLTSTDLETITSCGPEVTDCPARNHTSSSVPTYEAGAATQGYYAAGAVALAAGALLM
ncbi:hypothetical protein DAMA08_015430 [Martiniozyma asiatica (nom. inval.)]|nr:hypothetical protein DAMA08_015420 [Martiniozyma asiatica]GMM28827.1 hypothetical protein DAMA08_015430 [Martiniozyma asiatica]